LIGRSAEELNSLKSLSKARLKERLTKGELTSGFIHTLYPEGDPRSKPLLALMSDIEETGEDLRFQQAVCTSMKERGIDAPTIDLALMMVCSFLEISEEFASVIFGIARSPGLFTHYQEQRMSRFMVRPRARYSGR